MRDFIEYHFFEFEIYSREYNNMKNDRMIGIAKAPSA